MKAYRTRYLYDGDGLKKNVFLIVKDNRIVEITRDKPECEIIECDVITPALIDAHSHIGMSRYGEPISEDESNDIVSQILPSSNPINSVYFDDEAFQEAVEHGVLYSIIVPGSGNVLGGQAVLIRNFAKNRAQGFFKQIGYKLALGFNPRSTTEWKGTRPSTRMGVYALLEAKLEKLRRKLKKLELEKITEKELEEELKFMEQEFLLSLSIADRHLISMLKGEKLAKVHVHKEDDAIYLIELKRKFGLKVVADHLCDVHTARAFNMLAGENVDATYGPIDSFPYKVELKHESYRNVRALVRSRLRYCIMTDHPVVLSRNLFLQGRFFLRYGLKKEEVVSLMTKNAAEIHNIAELGMLKKGKLASFVIWDGDPFSLESRVVGVVCEGRYKEIRN